MGAELKRQHRRKGFYWMMEKTRYISEHKPSSVSGRINVTAILLAAMQIAVFSFHTWMSVCLTYHDLHENSGATPTMPDFLLKSDNIFCVGDLPSMTHTAFGCWGRERRKERKKEIKKERNKERKKVHLTTFNLDWNVVWSQVFIYIHWYMSTKFTHLAIHFLVFISEKNCLCVLMF